MRFLGDAFELPQETLLIAARMHSRIDPIACKQVLRHVPSIVVLRSKLEDHPPPAPRVGSKNLHPTQVSKKRRPHLLRHARVLNIKTSFLSILHTQDQTAVVHDVDRSCQGPQYHIEDGKKDVILGRFLASMVVRSKADFEV